MSFTLRTYQQIATDASVAFLTAKKPRNGIVVIPTGGGKSLVIAATVAQLDGQCLVFQPSKELLDQNFAKFVAYGYRPAIFSASVGMKRVGEITLATIGSVAKHAERFKDVRYVLVDECHFNMNAKGGMYTTFLDSLNDVRILGLTATPFRLSTDGFGGSILKFLTRTRPRIFQDVVHVTQIGDLYRDGYLAKLTYEVIKGFDRSKLRVNSTGADYTDESVQREFSNIGFADMLTQRVAGLIKEGRRVLVFTRFIAEARALSERLGGVEYVTGETGKSEREDCIRRFKTGRTMCCANVNVLGVGFDYPELDTVVLASPTMSLARYYQWVGRAIRPHASKVNGSLIVDMVGLVEQFGGVEDLVCEQVAGKWVITSKGRQLTNIYYGQKEADGAEFVVSHPVLNGMQWDDAGSHREAKADWKFWAAWKTDKDKMREYGISPCKEGVDWIVKWKKSAPMPAF